MAEELVEIGVSIGVGPLRTAGRELAGIAIAERDDLCLREVAVRGDVEGVDLAEADDPDASGSIGGDERFVHHD